MHALLSKRIIGKKHTPEGNVLRRIKHLPPDERRRILKEWEECKKNGLVLTKKSTGEVHVSLNPKKIPKIMELCENG